MNASLRSFTISLVRRLYDDSGAQLVEFALSVVVLIMFLFGVLAFCYAMYTYHFVSYAAQEGSRFAMVRGADWPNTCTSSAPPNFAIPYSCRATSTDVQNFVRSIASPGINPNEITVTATWPGTAPNCTSNCAACSTATSSGCYVRVLVTYPYLLNVPFMRQSTFTFSGTSEKVIQY